MRGGVRETHLVPCKVIYFIYEAAVCFLLTGGDKSTQKRDIARAKDMARGLKEITYAPFDVAEYLDNDKAIAEYLTATLEDDNPDVFLAALGDVAKARGMAQIAEAAGLGRESLYKAFGEGAHPAMKPSTPCCMRLA